ncbi:MAG: PAS domain-containing protein, partial [Brevundimonas sp.]
MPYEATQSPVAPSAGSRLWTVGASAGVSIVVMIGLAVAQPTLAPWLVGGALLVGVSTWAVNRRPRSPRSEDTALEAAPAAIEAADQWLLDNAFEALADPVLVISGGEADDIAGRRVVLANGAARELFRIQREGALLVSALREPSVLEAVDEALFGGIARTTDYAGVGAQTRHWRALT